MALKILHTSDWHLGHHLFHKDRKREHGLFLDWLLNLLSEKSIDLLIIAGDIFDSVAPPNYALSLYYDFLRRVADTPCRQTIIVGGNHDSAASLHAPRELLKLFDIHVVGAINTERPEDDLVLLRDEQERAAGIVCAVPFLRERDVRAPVAGEDYLAKNRAYYDGVADHYRLVAETAIAKLSGDEKSTGRLPLIGTGHLFAAGGELSEGIREVSVGSLSAVPCSVFPKEFDYLALGHLHKTQSVKGFDHIKYCGSPIPLSFGEAGSEKKVSLVTFAGHDREPVVEELPVPSFQKIVTIRGGWQEVEDYFGALTDKDAGTWVEIQLETREWGPGVQERVSSLAHDKPVEVLAVRNLGRVGAANLDVTTPEVALSELKPEEVFARLLARTGGVEESEMPEVMKAFQEVLQEAWRLQEGELDED